MYETMTTRRRALLGGAATAFAGVCGSPAVAAPPAGVDRLVRQVMDAFDTPGLALAVVEDGAVTHCKGYGVRRLGEAAPVTPATAFNIASCSKAFTAAALAVLVDEGKLAWTDPVIDHMPRFRMWDPYVTREMTVRDLLLHNSGLGLGAGDLLFWPNTTYTPADAVERLRHLKPATSFRAGYAYDNILYIVAYELIAEVAGVPYERFLAERLFRRMGMTATWPSNAWLPREADQAWPHARLGGPVRGLGPMTPVGRRPGIDDASLTPIVSGAADMARWLQVLLARGALPGPAPSGGRLFSEGQAREMWTGRTVIQASAEPRAAPQAPAFVLYGLGWFLQDYRGFPHLWHTGGTTGMSSLVVVVPERKTGFCVLINAEEGMVLRTLKNSLLDHYLGLSRQDWLASSLAFHRQEEEALKARAARRIERPANATPPSLPLAAYAGTYRDAWYGEVVIAQAGDGLAIDFVKSPTMKGALQPWTRDVFRTRFSDRNVEDAFLSFSLTPDGAVSEVKLQAVSPDADFSYDYQDLLLKPVAAPKP